MAKFPSSYTTPKRLSSGLMDKPEALPGAWRERTSPRFSGSITTTRPDFSNRNHLLPSELLNIATQTDRDGFNSQPAERTSGEPIATVWYRAVSSANRSVLGLRGCHISAVT